MTDYVRRRLRRVSVRQERGSLDDFWSPMWLVTCEGCRKGWYWDSWSQAMRWAESTAKQCCKGLSDMWEAKPTRRIDLWGTRTTSSGAFPKARRDPHKLRYVKKEDR